MLWVPIYLSYTSRPIRDTAVIARQYLTRDIVKASVTSVLSYAAVWYCVETIVHRVQNKAPEMFFTITC